MLQPLDPRVRAARDAAIRALARSGVDFETISDANLLDLYDSHGRPRVSQPPLVRAALARWLAVRPRHHTGCAAFVTLVGGRRLEPAEVATIVGMPAGVA